MNVFIDEIIKALNSEGFEACWSKCNNMSALIEIHKDGKHVAKEYIVGFSVEHFCKKIIKEFKKAHYTIDDLTNLEDLYDFCRQHDYAVVISKAYKEPTIYTVSHHTDKIVRHVNDRNWTHGQQVCFIKNMLKVVTTEADKMADSDFLTASAKVDFRYHGKTDFIKEYLNSTYGKSAFISSPAEIRNANLKHIFRIKKVIFNNPATIVIWADGTKTVVKATDEEFDPEKGLAMAISKKALGNKREYFAIYALEKQIPEKISFFKGPAKDIHFCPVCKRHIFKKENYCAGCGQALDWSRRKGE